MSKYTCECNSINWDKYYEDFKSYDNKKCKCCLSKYNRNEITYLQYTETCEDYIKYYSKGIKHVFTPCTW
jgi:hypothetical protein